MYTSKGVCQLVHFKKKLPVYFIPFVRGRNWQFWQSWQFLTRVLYLFFYSARGGITTAALEALRGRANKFDKELINILGAHCSLVVANLFFEVAGRVVTVCLLIVLTFALFKD